MLHILCPKQATGCPDISTFPMIFHRSSRLCSIDIAKSAKQQYHCTTPSISYESLLLSSRNAWEKNVLASGWEMAHTCKDITGDSHWKNILSILLCDFGCTVISSWPYRPSIVSIQLHCIFSAPDKARLERKVSKLLARIHTYHLALCSLHFDSILTDLNLSRNIFHYIDSSQTARVLAVLFFHIAIWTSPSHLMRPVYFSFFHSRIRIMLLQPPPQTSNFWAW